MLELGPKKNADMIGVSTIEIYYYHQHTKPDYEKKLQPFDDQFDCSIQLNVI